MPNPRALPLAVSLLVGRAAWAENPCADLDVGIATSCQVVGGDECVTMCDSIRFDASCEAENYEACSGMCAGDATADCTAMCRTPCTSACAVDPAIFDCSGQCQATCKADCALQCATDATCRARCGGYCAGACDAECQGTPASADCNVKCDSSCAGSCEARVDFECHMSCQTNGYATCEAMLTETCRTQCDAEGALVCNSQFVAADDLDACVEFLRDAGVTVDVMVDSGGGGTCAVGVGLVGRRGVGVLLGLIALALVTKSVLTGTRR